MFDLKLKIDDEAFDSLVVSYLKDSVSTVMEEMKHMKHPEDRAYNAHLLPALLTVVRYYSIPNEYDQYVHQVFDDINEDNDDEQMSFKFDEDDNEHPEFHYTVKGDEE